MFDEKNSKFAAKKLGLPDDWELVYQSVSVSHIYDAEDVTDQLSEEIEGEKYLADAIDEDTIRGAVDMAAIDINLPQGMRLVGMSPVGDEGRIREYGFVDFSDLGAD